MYSIAYVEDEFDLSTLVIKYLNNEGYKVKHYKTGEEALLDLSSKYDLWILDIMLPGGINGYDLIKKIRQDNPKLPVIFTSARDQDIDKVMGLELGSDDYIAKPFSIRELVLRVKNIINRVYNNTNHNNYVDYNSYKIDIEKRNVYENDKLINLTAKEFDLLIYLLKNKGKPFSRDQILDNVWGLNYYGSDRVVDDLMRRLRQKMTNLNIETIYGYGYRLL